MKKEIKAEGIDHLGIVSAICDEINLVETIDSIIPKKSNMNISIGMRVKAMVLNALGFTGRALYLNHQFFQKKPLDLLLGPDIATQDLNDDAMGRALDEIYKAGAELVYCTVAMQAIKNYKVKIEDVHGDTTSISVEGAYDGRKNNGLIRFGYSKDLRKDLKQFILSSFVTGDGGIPIFGSAVAGNTSDAKYFRAAFRALKENIVLDLDGITLINDAAAYNAETIKSLDWATWIFRVPDTIGEAKSLKINTTNESFIKLSKGYSIFESHSSYGDVEQRWLIVRSEKALERSKKSIARKVDKEINDLETKIKKGGNKEFGTINFAKQLISKILSKTKYHTIEVCKISSSKIKCGIRSGIKKIVVGNVEILIHRCNDKIQQAIDLKSKFIIATNQLDESKLSGEMVLLKYKNQFKVEKGFRFLKNPLCMASSIYLKNDNRIIALSTVMLITLLVYSVAERALRTALVENNLCVRSQTNKPVQNPTIRWIFQKMEDIIVLRYVEDDKQIVQVTNLSDELEMIIRLLGSKCMKRYTVNT